MSNTTRMLPPSARSALALAVDQYQADLAESPACLEYLAARGIYLDPEMPEEIGNPARLGLVTNPHPEHEAMRGRLAIPYLVPRGGPVGMKFRCIQPHDCKAIEGHPKYLSHAGMGQRLYGVTALKIESPVIGITEGELDAYVATETGVPSVAVPGVKGWSDTWSYLFEGYERVLVFGDGDSAGLAFAEKLCAQIHNARAVPFPDREDLSSFVMKFGADALLERCS